MSAVRKGRRSKYRRKGRKKETDESQPKSLFKTVWLCYSVKEADKAFLGEFTRSFSAWADRGDKARKQGFNIGWMHIPAEKFTANMYSGRKVGLVGVLFAATADDHASGDALGKVVHGKPCENLLEDVFHFFRVKSGKTNRVW